MCTGQPTTVGEALAGLLANLAFLNRVPAADLPGAVQADCLRQLAQAESARTAAHARMLGAFSASGAHEDDGQQSERAWLRWQTQITAGAAAGAVGWMKRLQAHPAVRAALAAGAVSPSWARKICEWTDLLPEAGRGDADEILLAAAAGGAVLPDLAALAEEMRRRTAAPDRDDPGGGFDARRVRLGLTFGGAGVLEGDLTPACAAALAAVLEALGKKAGPEDARTAPQRRHDALEEACRRLIGAGFVPDRAGQPTHIQLHLTLDQLRDLPGAAAAQTAWVAAQSGAAAGPGAAAAPDSCPAPAPAAGQPYSAAQPPSGQATRDPQTTPDGEAGREGEADHGGESAHGGEARSADAGRGAQAGPGREAGRDAEPCRDREDARDADAGRAGKAGRDEESGRGGEAGRGGQAGRGGESASGGEAARGAQGARAAAEGQPGWLTGRAAQAYACDAAIIPVVTGQVDQAALAALAEEIRATTHSPSPGQPPSPAALARLHQTLLRHAAALLSGPGGLASFLRTRLTGDQFPAVSLPLDVGTPTSLISGSLRRAVITRDRHCAFPGCDHPPPACQVHHIKPRAQGGETALGNLVLLCSFHHLIAVHQRGWILTLNADGTTTAVSPDRTRTLHSHGPPSRAA